MLTWEKIPGSPCFSLLQAMESWAGPGNEAMFCMHKSGCLWVYSVSPSLVGLLEITVQPETFVGENFRKLVDKRFSWRKLLQIVRWSRHKMPCPQIARRKLANSHKTSKFANFFSLESFPVYSRCSVQARGYKMLVHRIYSIKKPLGPW